VKHKNLDLSTELITKGKLATIKKLKADVLSIRSEEGPMLETSSFNFSTVANLPYQLS